MQKIGDQLTTFAKYARQAISMANFIIPSSQKCNFKILGWREQPKEILKENFCKILKQRADIDVNPADILAIHRVPGNRDGGPRPVIMRMNSSEAKLRIIKHQKLM